jgi:hypothetical protein
MELISNPNAWIALLTLTFLEIILGIDNIVFLSIVSGKLSEKEQPKARRIGLTLAMAFRIILLFGITWVLSLQKTLLSLNWGFFEAQITGQSIIIFGGGLFLLYKSVSEIHHKMEGEEENSDAINDGGRIGGFKLFELSQSDYRKCEMPIKCQVEAWINKKFKEYLNREVQNVWKVINRRQVICSLPFHPFPFFFLSFSMSAFYFARLLCCPREHIFCAVVFQG